MNKRTLFFVRLILGFAAILPLPALADDHWDFANFGAGAKGDMKQEKNKLTITTQNTVHCYFESDSYSFASQPQVFPYDDCSRSTISVKIEKLNFGSAGIMMRSGAALGAANVHLEISATGDLLLFYRVNDNDQTLYTRITTLTFPMEIRLIRQGSVFTGYYKNAKGDWTKGNSVIANVGEQSLIGFYGCSGSESQIGYSQQEGSGRKAEATFSDWDIQYEEHYLPAEENFKDKMPVKDGTLLRDNFDDGSLSNKPVSIINPVWNGIKYGNLPKNADGGRSWRKNGDGTFYLGNKKWADYQVSIDLTFDAASKPTSEFLMQLRYQNISVYGAPKYYAVALREGNKLFFEKYDAGAVVFSKSVSLPNYFNGTKHQLMVKMLDRNYEVYYDNKLILSGIDTEKPVTYGNICLKFTDVAINMDNLEVLQVKDPVNGDTDNFLQNYYDTPIPEYLKKYGY
jgi:hypothetical protein